MDRAQSNFSRKELQEIRAYYRAWIGEIADPTPFGILDADEIGRAMRAFYWVQAGRSAPGTRTAHRLLLHGDGKPIRNEFG